MCFNIARTCNCFMVTTVAAMTSDLWSPVVIFVIKLFVKVVMVML